MTFAVVLWHFRCSLGSLGVSGLSTSQTLAQVTQPGLIDHSPLDDLPDGSFIALLLPASRLPHRATGLRILDIPPRWGDPRSSIPCFGIRFQLLILVFPTQEPMSGLSEVSVMVTENLSCLSRSTFSCPCSARVLLLPSLDRSDGLLCQPNLSAAKLIESIK